MNPGSGAWETSAVIARLRSAARRLLGRPASDWAGPDASRALELESERIGPEAPRGPSAPRS